jgi:hypothetical protein
MSRLPFTQPSPKSSERSTESPDSKNNSRLIQNSSASPISNIKFNPLINSVTPQAKDPYWSLPFKPFEMYNDDRISESWSFNPLGANNYDDKVKSPLLQINQNFLNTPTISNSSNNGGATRKRKASSFTSSDCENDENEEKEEEEEIQQAVKRSEKMNSKNKQKMKEIDLTKEERESTDKENVTRSIEEMERQERKSNSLNDQGSTTNQVTRTSELKDLQNPNNNQTSQDSSDWDEEQLLNLVNFFHQSAESFGHDWMKQDEIKKNYPRLQQKSADDCQRAVDERLKKINKEPFKSLVKKAELALNSHLKEKKNKTNKKSESEESTGKFPLNKSKPLSKSSSSPVNSKTENNKSSHPLQPINLTAEAQSSSLMDNLHSRLNEIVKEIQAIKTEMEKQNQANKSAWQELYHTIYQTHLDIHKQCANSLERMAEHYTNK